MSIRDTILTLTKGKGVRQLIKNFLSLSIIQGLDMLLPLLTVPYLIRVIGVENVGLLAFVNAVIGYFGIFINYGFSLTATKEISQHIGNKAKIQQIFNVVFTAKNYLLGISFLVLLLLVAIIPSVAEHSYIYLITFGTIACLNISPTWYFQGIQQLKFVTFSNIITKLFFTLMIFIFVKERSDFWMVPTFTLIGASVSSILSIVYVIRIHRIKIEKPKLKYVVAQYKRGKYIFLSQIKITFFSNMNVLILGVVLGNAAVGVFSSADKIIKVMSAVQIPIVSALFPYFSRLFKTNYKVAYANVRKVALYGSMIYAVIIIIIFILSDLISSLLFGSGLSEIPILIRIMCSIPLFVFLNNLYGTQTLLNLNHDKSFLYNMIIAAIINSVLLYPLIKIFGVYGVACSVLITEFYLFASMYVSSVKIIDKLKND
ncbi:flippase [Pedobacter aquae]|uniref:Flippase n=1 Tax=Pedobacter aquae TaxID=2605747 RepID=A0A5C0VKJ2_9SPHI|nr:flippase [Pedobacter aquae]QEK52213.1 flippase [Pedobacter aquae]